MLLSKHCKFLQQDQKCLLRGSYCDPLCTKVAYGNPNEADSPEEGMLLQPLPEIWAQKKAEPPRDCASVFARSFPGRSTGIHSSGRFKERRKHRRFQIGLPLEFKSEDGLPHGAIVHNISEGGLLICSTLDMPVGRELRVGVFFADEYELDQLMGTSRIAWKVQHSEADWEGYKYALEFVEISVENRWKYVRLVNNHSSVEGISERFENSKDSFH